MRPSTTLAIANQVENDPVVIVAGECPMCGDDRPIRLFAGKSQCGHCGFLIAPERK